MNSLSLGLSWMSTRLKLMLTPSTSRAACSLSVILSIGTIVWAPFSMTQSLRKKLSMPLTLNPSFPNFNANVHPRYPSIPKIMTRMSFNMYPYSKGTHSGHCSKVIDGSKWPNSGLRAHSITIMPSSTLFISSMDCPHALKSTFPLNTAAGQFQQVFCALCAFILPPHTLVQERDHIFHRWVLRDCSIPLYIEECVFLGVLS